MKTITNVIFSGIPFNNIRNASSYVKKKIKLSISRLIVWDLYRSWFWLNTKIWLFALWRFFSGALFEVTFLPFLIYYYIFSLRCSTIAAFLSWFLYILHSFILNWNLSVYLKPQAGSNSLWLIWIHVVIRKSILYIYAMKFIHF